jgi:NAD(P)-dependent dehydrogenase (short-subunit alcohol dehydrogenase family)
VFDFAGKVGVVTGGASGIGRGLVEALLEVDATVVIADVEATALDETVRELSDRGAVSGIVTDVADAASVEACADAVFRDHGACHVLFNNAGVGGGGVAKPWNWTPNDWAWCIGVNLIGVGHCVSAFVPRMLDTGVEGWVVNTSSSNGGFQPLADLGVYAASKAGVTAFTESLANAFANEGTRLHAALFYPGGGGIMETQLWNSSRNRPPHLAREHPHVDRQYDYAAYKEQMAASGVGVADLVAMGRTVLDAIRAGHFLVAPDLPAIGELFTKRAEKVARGELPTTKTGGAFE